MPSARRGRPTSSSRPPPTRRRGLLNTNSFAYADLTNQQFGLNPWFPNAANPALPNGFDPLIQDAGFYGLNTYGP